MTYHKCWLINHTITEGMDTLIKFMKAIKMVRKKDPAKYPVKQPFNWIHELLLRFRYPSNNI